MRNTLANSYSPASNYKIIQIAGICLEGKLNPFSDISQNSTLEKRTLHKIQYEENRLFTKFNSVHVYVFRRALHLAPIFSEVKYKPFTFLEV